MRFFTSVYLLLLVYIVTALGYWEHVLQKQSGRIYAQEVLTLKSRIDSVQAPYEFNQELVLLKSNLNKRTFQYIGEGSAFLVVTLIGAFIVYTSFRRRIILSRQQNNFMLSVTHELKSPIAAMKLNLQTLEKHQLDKEKKSLLIDRCIKESNRLNDLCNNVLFASQIDGRQYKPTREAFNLSEMTEYAVEQYAARYPQRFEEEIKPGCHITGDKVMLQIVLNNLLENAAKYTPNDKPVSITLHTMDNNAIISVADKGAGIPDSEKKKIFNKFYRVGNEESRKAQGTGIGLYLAHKVILQHHGRITVKDNSPSGAIFEICLPLG